jgi:hypothetical protein
MLYFSAWVRPRLMHQKVEKFIKPAVNLGPPGYLPVWELTICLHELLLSLPANPKKKRNEWFILVIKHVWKIKSTFEIVIL